MMVSLSSMLLSARYGAGARGRRTGGAGAGAARFGPEALTSCGGALGAWDTPGRRRVLWPGRSRSAGRGAESRRECVRCAHGYPPSRRLNRVERTCSHGLLCQKTSDGSEENFRRLSFFQELIRKLQAGGLLERSRHDENGNLRFQLTNDSYGYALGANVAFDSAGNLYGSTAFRYGNPDGTVFELMNSGGTWTIDALYSFFGETYVDSGLAVDSAGNVYGTTWSEAGTCGTVFELTPSGSGWVFNTIYSFTCGDDGAAPEGTPVLDQAGNLYGTTHSGGSGGGAGTVFELSPSGGGWTFSLLYSFVEGIGGPGSALTMDPAGNFYGTTVKDGANSQGNVFKLTRSGNS